MDNLGTAIPNLSYDLIVRFCPGILVIALILIDPQVQTLSSNQIPPTISVAFFLVGSYVMGFLINIFSDFIAFGFNFTVHYLISRFYKRNVWILDAWEVMLKYGYQEESTYILNIRKCLAELGLFRSLFTAWLFLWLFQLSLLNNINWSSKAFILAVLGFSCFQRELAVRRVTQRFLDSKQEDEKQYAIGKVR